MSQIRLTQVILRDWRRYRLALLLMFACLLTALAVVHSSHVNRQLISSHNQLDQQRDNLDIEWRNLLLEQRALSEHSRVEAIANSRLQMRRPSGDRDVMVTLP
ncbi:cell division protein FtsL [Alkalimonas collagenimarina]|uniref:Cell division protein FtsL n=1 Tax=Alkalimonas collagenimarina TaxID=400390 RepID=A0ABT9GZL0_9GAMM|nr:cell division protein FtsL [Alkalimonas collagenimarina]MDP4536493.1 cell division protein FtsL [Alkalimonas collagenimarina]